MPIPEGLDLDEWINDPPSEPEDNASIQHSPSNNQLFVKTNNYQNNQQPDQKYTSLSSSGTGGNMNYGGGSQSFHNIAGSHASSNGYNNSSSGFGVRQGSKELSQEELDKFKENRKLQNDSNPFFLKSSAPSMKKSESNSFAMTTKASNSHDSIRSQSIDLKTALNIPGVTSSENYYRMNQIDIENKKLRKKMKAKDSKKKNKKGSKSKDEEAEEDEEEPPVVKVLDNEMPEGFVEGDSDDEASRRRGGKKDPHRALDINLDE